MVYPGGARDCKDDFKSTKFVFLPTPRQVYDIYTKNNKRMTTVAVAVKYAYGSRISPAYNGDIKVKVYVRPQPLATGLPNPDAMEVVGICRLPN